MWVVEKVKENNVLKIDNTNADWKGYDFFFFFENEAFIHSLTCKKSWYKASTAGGGESSNQ